MTMKPSDVVIGGLYVNNNAVVVRVVGKTVKAADGSEWYVIIRGINPATMRNVGQSKVQTLRAFRSHYKPWTK